MNFINNIEIKNFKSIRHQKIEGCKRINIFVGPPNVGKSNILEGLGLFGLLDHSLSQPITIQKLTRVKKNHELFFNGVIDEKINITLNENLSFDIIADSNLDINFSAIEKFPIPAPIDTSTWKNYPRRVSLGNFEFSSINDNVVKAGSNFQSSYLNPIKSIRKYIFNKSSVNIKFDTLVKHLTFPFGENISDIIFSNTELKNHLIEIFKIFRLRISRSESQGTFHILKELPDTSVLILDYDLIADTLQRLIFHKAAILSNENSVLIFEEPEANMHPPYISKFTSDIINDENNNQFFIATHSPFVLNDLMENAKNDLAIYLVDYKKETGETIINKMSDEDMHEAYQFGYDFFLNIKQFLPQNT